MQQQATASRASSRSRRVGASASQPDEVVPDEDVTRQLFSKETSSSSSRTFSTSTISSSRLRSNLASRLDEESDAEASHSERADDSPRFTRTRNPFNYTQLTPAHGSGSSTSFLLKSPLQQQAERDSTVYGVDACDSHHYQKELHLPSAYISNSDFLHNNINNNNGTSSNEPRAPSPMLSETACQFWDGVYDIFPFFFAGPGFRIASAVLRTVGAKGLASKFDAMDARYRTRRCHFPWALVLFLFFGIIFYLYSGAAVAWIKAQRPAYADVAVNNVAGLKEGDLVRIQAAITREVRKDLSDLLKPYVTKPELQGAEQRLEKLIVSSLKGVEDKVAILANHNKVFVSESQMHVYVASIYKSQLLAKDGEFFKSLAAQIKSELSQSVTDAAKAAAAAEAASKLASAVADATRSAKEAAAAVARDEVMKATAAQAAAAAAASATKGDEGKVKMDLEALRSVASEAAQAAAKSIVDAEIKAANAKTSEEITKQTKEVATAASAKAVEAAAATEKALREYASGLVERLDARVKAIEAALAEQKKQAAELQRSVEGLSTQFAEAKDLQKHDIADLKKLVEAVAGKADKALKDALSASAAESEQNKALETAANQAVELTSTMAQLAERQTKNEKSITEQVAKLTDKVNNLVIASATASGSATTASTQALEERAAEIKAMRNEVDAVKAAVENIIKSAANDVKNAQAEVAAVAGRLSEVEKTIAELKKSDVKQQGDITALADKVSSLEQAIAEAVKSAKASASSAAIDEVRAKVESLASTAVSLERQVSEQAKAQAASADKKSTVDMSAVNDEIDRRLEVFAADRTGLVDYADKGAGGRIIEHSPTFVNKVEISNVLKWITSCYVPTKQPDTVIESPAAAVGDCWPMEGSKGHIVIRLAAPIRVTKVSLQQASQMILSDGSSVPKQYRVFGLTREQVASKAQGNLLGSFTYRLQGPRALQFGEIPASAEGSKKYEYVRLEIDSNHGHKDYTCISRFRVHGWPHDSPIPPAN